MLCRFGSCAFGYAAIRVVLSATALDHGVPLRDVSIPPPIDGLAKAERLGEPVSVHDPRTENPRARTWLVVLGLPGLVLLPFTVRSFQPRDCAIDTMLRMTSVFSDGVVSLLP